MSERSDVLNLLILSEALVNHLLGQEGISDADRRRLHKMKRLRKRWRCVLDYVPDEVWAEVLEFMEEVDGEQQKESPAGATGIVGTINGDA